MKKLPKIIKIPLYKKEGGGATTIKPQKHVHRWQYSEESCIKCGYEERCCKNCTVCQGRAIGEKWEEVSN